jgi:uncharacterized protein YdhG (YjbR/CyaY superfamily)
MKKAADVDEYIENAPTGAQGKLRQIRAAIREVAPNAQERISYGMPYYDYKGRLIYFGLAKAHIGLYIPTPVLQEHKAELSDYQTTNATLRIPLDRDVPIDLIKGLVRARMKKNEASSPL